MYLSDLESSRGTDGNDFYNVRYGIEINFLEDRVSFSARLSQKK